MGPPGAAKGAPQSAHLSSPAPGLRRPTRHLSPALPTHTPRTPAAPRALPPPTLRLPPLPAGADARASPAGAAPASQGVCARPGSAATGARVHPWAVASQCRWLSHLRPSSSGPRPSYSELGLILSTPILCSNLLYSRILKDVPYTFARPKRLAQCQAHSWCSVIPQLKGLAHSRCSAPLSHRYQTQ